MKVPSGLVFGIPGIRYPQFHSMAPSIVSRDHHSPSPGPTDGNLSGARHLGGRSAVSSIGLLFIYRNLEASMLLLLFMVSIETLNHVAFMNSSKILIVFVAHIFSNRVSCLLKMLDH